MLAFLFVKFVIINAELIIRLIRVIRGFKFQMNGFKMT